MSKTLEALKRVSEIRKNNAGSIDLKNRESAIHPSVAVGADIHVKDFSRGPSNFSAAYNGHIQDNSRHDSRFQNVTLAFLAFVGVVSLLLSFKTFTEIKRANNVSATVIKDISLQKAKMTTLEKAVATMQDDAASKERVVKDKLNKMAISINQSSDKIDDLIKENKQLRSLVGDLKWSVQSLTDKYINVTTQLDNLSPKQ